MVLIVVTFPILFVFLALTFRVAVWLGLAFLNRFLPTNRVRRQAVTSRSLEEEYREATAAKDEVRIRSECIFSWYLRLIYLSAHFFCLFIQPWPLAEIRAL